MEQQLQKAMQEVYECMLEKIASSKAEAEAKLRHQKSHYALQKANERLQALDRELMQD